MSTASYQHRTGQSHGGSKRSDSGGGAPARAALPRYLTTGKATGRTDQSDRRFAARLVRHRSDPGLTPV